MRNPELNTVKWVDYPADANTWKSAESLDCRRFITIIEEDIKGWEDEKPDEDGKKRRSVACKKERKINPKCIEKPKDFKRKNYYLLNEGIIEISYKSFVNR